VFQRAEHPVPLAGDVPIERFHVKADSTRKSRAQHVLDDHRLSQ
jgi:hypothetical protein